MSKKHYIIFLTQLIEHKQNLVYNKK